MNLFHLRLVGSLLLLLVLSGCTHVAPFDKEYLATQKMLISPNVAESAFEGHVFPIREGSFGAESSFQGGCGCK